MWKQVWILILIFLLLACQEKEQLPEPLPAKTLLFETIAQDDTLKNANHDYAYKNTEPAVLVIARPEEIADPGLGITFDEATVDNLLQVDYTRMFVILVLRGHELSTGFGVTVQDVIRQNESVTANIDFSNPEKEMEMLLVETSPYHLVSVAKGDEQWGQDIEFVLQANGQKIKETTHFIP